MLKVTERRIVRQDWYETELTKTGWDSHGWIFEDGSTMGTDWDFVSHLDSDKHGNPILAVVEREVELTGKPDPNKETFFERMEKEMKANAHKGDWKLFATKENRAEILGELWYHYNKLVKVFGNGDEELIKEHSADVGNIAMFMYESTFNI